MTAKNNFHVQIPIKDFTARKQIKLFDTLKERGYNGCLVMTAPDGQNWTFHLHQGRIVYATGGKQPVRRWKRSVSIHSHLPADREIQQELAELLPHRLVCWEYELLHKWVERQQITRVQAAKTIGEILVEVLFDVTQALVVTCELRQDSSIPNILFLIKAEQVIARAEQCWQAWQAAGMANFSPNLAPILKPTSQLQQRTEILHQTLNRLMDGDKTLRDIAVQTKRDVVQLGRLLFPCINSGLVKLVDVADLAAPVPQKSAAPKTPLIACVDDSPLVCRALEEIISAAGYRFIGVNDSQQAIKVLSAYQPNLIFLDIEMPKLDGYEVCSQLRRLSVFLHTPIIFLTGYDGIFDRVRAKLAGSSGFLSKTVATSKVLKVIQKHLSPIST